MVRTAEQHSKLATLYEKLVTDQYATPDQRLKFAQRQSGIAFFPE
jgi:hypothetical protein